MWIISFLEVRYKVSESVRLVGSCKHGVSIGKSFQSKLSAWFYIMIQLQRHEDPFLLHASRQNSSARALSIRGRIVYKYCCSASRGLYRWKVGIKGNLEFLSSITSLKRELTFAYCSRSEAILDSNLSRWSPDKLLEISITFVYTPQNYSLKLILLSHKQL
jgi:hypothetical protein